MIGVYVDLRFFFLQAVVEERELLMAEALLYRHTPTLRYTQSVSLVILVCVCLESVPRVNMYFL